MVKQSFPLLGLHCAACAAHATKALQEVSGVQSASVNLATATAFVVFDETKTSLEALRDAISAVGYELRIDEPNPEELERLRMGQELALRRRALLAVLLSLFVMGLMMLGGAMTLPKALLSALAAGITLAVAGRDFFIRGWRQLQTRAAGMDLLVMLSTGTAYTFSLIQLGRYLLGAQDPHLLHHLYFEAASMTIAFVLLGKVPSDVPPQRYVPYSGANRRLYSSYSPRGRSSPCLSLTLSQGCSSELSLTNSSL